MDRVELMMMGGILDDVANDVAISVLQGVTGSQPRHGGSHATRITRQVQVREDEAQVADGDARDEGAAEDHHLLVL